MKRVALAAMAVVWLLVATVSAALAEWPTTCVELSDLIEASLGNDGNVGIYQRVHGDQAEAACRLDHGSDSFAFGGRRFMTPPKENPAAYTQAFVERAIDRYNTQGLQATLDYYNSPDSIDGQWYVFIANTDILLANAAVPSIVGTSSLDSRGPDGYPIGRHISAVATEQGAWVDYYWVNPESGQTQTKHSWNVLHDDLIFGSGWYEPGPSKDQPAAYTQAFVQRGIALYNDVGLDAVLDYYNTEQSLDGAWYLFVFDENDVLRTHAATPSLVDLHARDVLGPDGFPTGLQVVANATEDGAWVSYTWVNPESGEAQTKHSWVIRRDGLVFGSGWYEPGPPKAHPAAYTQAVVQRAIGLYDDVGSDVTFEYYGSEQSIDGQWYVFVLDENGNTLINPARPDFIGTSPTTRVDIHGKAYGYELVSAPEEGVWVDYWFRNPDTGAQQQKHAWAVRHDGLVFISGWYAPDKSDPAGYTQAFVARALARYDAEGREATIAYYNTTESVDGPWYVFIINEDDFTIGHHNPRFRNRDPSERVDVTGYFYGDDLLAADENGAWVSYVFLNPNTGEQETKHTWAVRHDGLLFGSGWYER